MLKRSKTLIKIKYAHLLFNMKVKKTDIVKTIFQKALNMEKLKQNKVTFMELYDRLRNQTDWAFLNFRATNLHTYPKLHKWKIENTIEIRI